MLPFFGKCIHVKASSWKDHYLTHQETMIYLFREAIPLWFTINRVSLPEIHIIWLLITLEYRQTSNNIRNILVNIIADTQS